jgi:hypothetical protein
VVPPTDLRFRETIMFPVLSTLNFLLAMKIHLTFWPMDTEQVACCKKYVIGKGTDVCAMKAPNNSYCFVLDIYLLKAECLVELNRPLKLLRSRSHPHTSGKPGISPALSQSEMRDAVRLERRRELALETTPLV